MRPRRPRRELRTTTQHAVEAKTREAEDAARARAKEIVGEARALRERVLADLEARRQELERQIGELRGGRGKLVETYELVERALADVARVMSEEPSTPPEMPTAASSDDAMPAETPAETPAVSDEPAEPAPSEAAAARAPSATDAPADSPADLPTDVGALFEKLRSGQAEETADAGTAPAEEPPAASEPEAVAEPEPEPPAEADAGAGGDGATQARDEALADATDDLVRRGKRALQDEQNDLLDGLRRQRGKIDTAKVLPGLDEQVARWAHVLQPAVDVAYSGGAGSVEGAAALGAAPRALLTELSTSVVSPLRERLSNSLEQLDARTPADLEIAAAQSLGARYREWRGDPLEGALGDALATAWSRGVFDAAPDGARLRWVPAVVGKCPDCDDNALEPTVKGNDFPTGQPHPPAHPGCRCLLVVEPD